jgi:hypothetical protein
MTVVSRLSEFSLKLENDYILMNVNNLFLKLDYDSEILDFFEWIAEPHSNVFIRNYNYSRASYNIWL